MAIKLKRTKAVRQGLAKTNIRNPILTRNEFKETRDITPEKAVKILAKSGVHLNENDAEVVLDAMYFIAKLITSQNFKK
jgi:hypothetical protein